MKILVLGHRGMLGKAVIAAACDAGHLPVHKAHSNVGFPLELMSIRDELQPNVVINCAGRIPSKIVSELSAIVTNSIGPRNVARVFSDMPVVNVSTDCIFSGRLRRPYTINDNPDPVDLYGRSKLLGEVNEPHVTTVRTSFVGLDHGLVPWFRAQPESAAIDGWRNAWWSGSTVWEVAKRLVEIAETAPRGLVHLATHKTVTKYEVLLWLRFLFKRDDIIMREVGEPRIFRNLESTYMLAPFESVMGQLVEHDCDRS